VVNVGALGALFVVEFQRQVRGDGEIVFGTLKPKTGKIAELVVLGSGDPLLGFSAAWTVASPAHLPLTRDGLNDAILEGQAISLLDLGTGAVKRDVFTIDTPWLCYPGDYCLRH
jgi:hypothetical protein